MMEPASPAPTMTTSYFLVCAIGRISAAGLDELFESGRRLGPITEAPHAVAHRVGLHDLPDEALLVGLRRNDLDGGPWICGVIPRAHEPHFDYASRDWPERGIIKDECGRFVRATQGTNLSFESRNQRAESSRRDLACL